MGEPLVFVGVDVEFGPEWMGIELTLGARIDQRPLLVIEGPALEIAFDDVSPCVRPQILHDPANMREQRVIAPQGVFSLKEVVGRKQQEGEGDDQPPS